MWKSIARSLNVLQVPQEIDINEALYVESYIPGITVRYVYNKLPRSMLLLLL